MKIRFLPYDKNDEVSTERAVNSFTQDKKVIDIVKLDKETIMIKYEDIVIKDRSRQYICIPNEVAEGKYIYLRNGKVKSMGDI